MNPTPAPEILFDLTPSLDERETLAERGDEFHRSLSSSSETGAHGENFMEIFTILSVVIWFSTGTLGTFATLVYVFTMRVVIYDILSMAIIPILSTSILFVICAMYYCEIHHAVW